MNTESPMCAEGCGFYGSIEIKNMCSKCYKDYVKQHNVTAESAMFASSMDKFNLDSFASGISWPLSKTSDDPVSNNDHNNIDININTGEKKNRCRSCKGKDGVLRFECRCGGVFCGKHRHPEAHACNLDLKKAGRDALAKQNPVFKGDKLNCRI